MSDIGETLKERGATHGPFGEQAALSQKLKSICRYNEDRRTDAQNESLDMICHKMSRILVGNADFADHWFDIEGYAELIVKEIKEKGA